ncbi:membrane protein [Gordoniibacillus kamchatkensis]|uniref:Membrane protein n=1 Tax=Gordoniibacillus kamchatkensis TaxID=1590651 RepID=A0ABR5ACD5_9BACL|nr:membrane protein [Paenibacillus sp. VKM B-2647]
MNAKEKEKDVSDVELAVSRWLRIGVYVSATVIIFGLILFFVRGSSGYQGDAYPNSLPDIVRGIMALRPYAVIMLGIILLILTPVLRVAISVWVFKREGDKLYVGITSIVLVILIVSFLLGKA